MGCRETLQLWRAGLAIGHSPNHGLQRTASRPLRQGRSAPCVDDRVEIEEERAVDKKRKPRGAVAAKKFGQTVLSSLQKAEEEGKELFGFLTGSGTGSRSTDSTNEPVAELDEERQATVASTEIVNAPKGTRARIKRTRALERGKIFISYAREDSGVAGRLYDDLKQNQLDPWLDTKDLLPGERWKDRIRQAIEESKYFIAVLSNNSVNKRGFIQRELHQALQLLEEFPPGSIFLIPARIDECRPRHTQLTDLNWVDLFPSYDDGFSRIMRVLRPEAVPPRAKAERHDYSPFNPHEPGRTNNPEKARILLERLFERQASTAEILGRAMSLVFDNEQLSIFTLVGDHSIKQALKERKDEILLGEVLVEVLGSGATWKIVTPEAS